MTETRIELSMRKDGNSHGSLIQLRVETHGPVASVRPCHYDNTAFDLLAVFAWCDEEDNPEEESKKVKLVSFKVCFKGKIYGISTCLLSVSRRRKHCCVVWNRRVDFVKPCV